MSKIILKGFILVPTEELSAVKEELKKHKALTLKERGCLVFEVNQDLINPNRFNVYEEFIDKAAFEYHQERVKSSKWGDVSANVQRYYKISE